MDIEMENKNKTKNHQCNSQPTTEEKKRNAFCRTDNKFDHFIAESMRKWLRQLQFALRIYLALFNADFFSYFLPQTQGELKKKRIFFQYEINFGSLALFSFLSSFCAIKNLIHALEMKENRKKKLFFTIKYPYPT